MLNFFFSSFSTLGNKMTKKAGQGALVAAVLLSLFASALNVRPAAAAIPTGYSEYFIPGFSDDLMHVLEDIAIANDATTPYNNTAGDQLTNLITISVGGDAVLYYDHWENGYSTGAAGDRTFTVHKGDVLTFRSTNIPEPRGTSLTCAGSVSILNGASSTTNECYDGRDRIYVVGASISVAQGYWPTLLNTNFANAWEIYPVKPYQTSYIIPVGEDMYGPTYFDAFGVQAYNNTDGSANWSGDSWVESGADAAGSPTAGTTHIVGGKLRFDGTAAASNIDRRVNLNGSQGATLSFDYAITDTIEAGDTLQVQASNGAGYTTLVTLTGGNGNFTTGSGSYTVNLTGYNNANSRIRFIATGFTDGAEALDIDNVRVHYTTTAATDGRRDFQDVYVLVSAYENGVNIQIDDPETPGVEVNVTKNKGETVYLDHIFAGTQVTASSPVQVQFLIGQTQTYNSRSYTAVPSGLWSTEYYSPVPGGTGGADTDLYVFNPTASPLVVDWADTSGSGSFTVPANSAASYRDSTAPNHYVPLNSAVYLKAHDGTTKFWAIGGADVGSSTYNWGFTLIPPQELTDEYYVSWAPGGWDQTTGTPQQSDYSPVYVTSTEDNTAIYVDYSPTDGVIDATYYVNRLQVQRVFDQTSAGHTRDADNTGVHIWSSAPIALVWGQDTTGISPTASPGLDAGYTMLPFNQEWLDVVLLMEKSASPSAIPNAAGQTSVFTLVVQTGDSAVDDVNVTDTMPANWGFVNNSAVITYPNGSTVSGAAANPGVSLPALTWNLSLDMNPHETLTIQFTGITTAAPGGTSNNQAKAVGVYSGYTFTAEDSASVGISELKVNKTSSIIGVAHPGDQIAYTVEIVNNGTIRENRIVVNDFLPAGTTYVANSSKAVGWTLTGSSSHTYRDEFSSQSYSLNAGSDNFSANWAETNETTDAASGRIRVNNANWRLRFENLDTVSIERTMDLSAATSATLTLDWWRVGGNESVAVQLWNGTAYETVATTPASGGASGTFTYTLTASQMSADSRIRFTTNSGNWDGVTEIVEIDNAQIQFNVPAPAAATKDNITGGTYPDLVSGAPSTLVAAADGFVLGPGQSMTVTYLVAVNSPATRTNIKNTARVTSDETRHPVSSTVTDPLPAAAIGNRVWLDENGDGVQDAGEAGIPNVTVELRNGSCTPGVSCPTTVTDANGNYIFANIRPGAYTVAVIGGLPSGLSANPTYDYDGVGTAHAASAAVVAGQERIDLDFGYNWTPAADAANPPSGATGSIGDHIWIDADGDGVQDSGEAGLAGVAVTLVSPGPDGVFGSSDDVAVAAAVTDAAGNYIFDGLAAGAYKVQVTPPSGYVQTGDPDQPGSACTICDGSATAPIILAPGDVYVNADFGYRLTGGGNAIGDQIFLDANGDGNRDAGEPGIPGVTVVLLDSGGKVIASTVADANGNYSFPGLPNGTYTVWVNDANNVLGELVQSSAPNNSVDGGQPCGACNNKNTIVVGGGGNNNQDFGYAPANHGSGDGLIGTTVFLDRDGNGSPNPGEGLEGVTVYLYKDANGNGVYDPGEPMLASTVTDENGAYYFGNLPAGAYVVKVDTSTLPAGVTNTVDQGSPTLNEGGVTLSAGQVVLAENFGYRDTSNPNTVGGTLWNDSDADGFMDGGESGRFANVTVVLYDANGSLVAAAKTDASGSYVFSNLPDGDYYVHVTDDGNLLNGSWKTSGANSQADSYHVNVSGGQTNTTGDFGFYNAGSTVGNYAWLDLDNDGIQGANEPALPGVTVTLNVAYPNGDTSSYSVVTGANGSYGFGNLLLDESFKSSGGGNPSYTLVFSTPPGTAASPTGAGTPATDSNGTNAPVAIDKGVSDDTYDSGFYAARLDLGDLPNPYPTIFSPGPAHVLFPDANADNKPETAGGVPAVWLGQIVDAELDGQPDANTAGDDTHGAADEDGLALASSGWTAGGSSTATVTINASQSSVTVYFGLWIDWDNNGSFDAFYNGSGVSGSPTAVNVTVSVPGSYTDDARIYMRVRAASFPLAASNYQGSIINGEVEDYWYKFNGGIPTPVTLSYFQAIRSGGAVLFTWSTSTETGNVGFNLYGGGQKLNEEPIPSNATDSLERQDYGYEAQTDADEFYIEDVSINNETSAKNSGRVSKRTKWTGRPLPPPLGLRRTSRRSTRRTR